MPMNAVDPGSLSSPAQSFEETLRGGCTAVPGSEPRAPSRDTSSLIRVYNAAWRSAASWSRRAGLPLDVTEDAVQDLAAEVATRYGHVPSVRTLVRLIQFRVTTRMRLFRRPRALAPVAGEDAVERLLRSERLAQIRASIGRLGKREQEVARQIADGCSLRKIAANLRLGLEQVRRSLSRIHAILAPIVAQEKCLTAGGGFSSPAGWWTEDQRASRVK